MAGPINLVETLGGKHKTNRCITRFRVIHILDTSAENWLVEIKEHEALSQDQQHHSYWFGSNSSIHFNIIVVNKDLINHVYNTICTANISPVHVYPFVTPFNWVTLNNNKILILNKQSLKFNAKKNGIFWITAAT